MCRAFREPLTAFARSADGAAIAYGRAGAGAPLMVVGGATAAIAEGVPDGRLEELEGAGHNAAPGAVAATGAAFLATSGAPG